MSKEKRYIKVAFDALDNGREYTGKQRGYILDNLKSVIKSPEVQERLRLRQLQGYFGHSMRELAGKLSLSAKEVLKLPNGQQIIADAIPACVTTDLDIDENGVVTHTQEILDNEEGDKVWSLHSNKVGGFSWATSGEISGGAARLASLFGFDYVPDPLNVNNKGWILDSESSDDSIPERNGLLKSLKENGVNKPGTVLDSWYASMALSNERYQQENAHYEVLLLDSQQEQQELRQVNDALNSQIQTLETLLRESKEGHSEALEQINDSHDSVLKELSDKYQTDLQQQQNQREDLLKQFQKDSPISIPDAVLDSLSNPSNISDLQPLNDFLHTVAGIKGSALPIGEKTKTEYVRGGGFDSSLDDIKHGSIGIAPEMTM